MNKTIQKPITVAQSELANKLMDEIKASNLHPSILMPVISEIYTVTQNLLQETMQTEMEEYQKNLSAESIENSSSERMVN